MLQPRTIKQTTVEDNDPRECVGMQGRRMQGVHGVRNAWVEKHVGKRMLGGWWGRDCKCTQGDARNARSGGCRGTEAYMD